MVMGVTNRDLSLNLLVLVTPILLRVMIHLWKNRLNALIYEADTEKLNVQETVLMVLTYRNLFMSNIREPKQRELLHIVGMF